VMLGTLYPLFLDALGLGKISVGPPYFESVFLPLMAPAIFLMGVGPLAKWKQAEVPELARRLRWAFGVALVTALLLPFTLGRWSPMISFGLLLALWVMISGFVNLKQRLQQLSAGGGNLGKRLSSLPRGYYGMLLAHFGVGVFIVGVTLVKGYEVEKDVRMQAGDTVEVGAYAFRLDGFVQVPGANYDATRGLVSVMKNGRPAGTMFPEKRLYHVQQMPMTEAAIDTGFTRDLYVSLGEPVAGDAWVVRIYYKPFVDWIWGGAFLMALGGIFAVSDKRYRLARRAEREMSSAAATVAG
jgi:cytochrome c-type biogenesis protein CcmF